MQVRIAVADERLVAPTRHVHKVIYRVANREAVAVPKLSCVLLVRETSHFSFRDDQSNDFLGL